MTTEELIVGHFEGSLSADQEQDLQSMLDASAEVRSLYDTHRHINMLIVSDAQAMEPSEKLNRKVIAASLMAIPEALVGTGATAWFTVKVVGGISAAVFGGLAVVSIVTSNARNDQEATTTTSPAVRRMPSVVPPPPPVLPGMEEVSQPTLGEGARAKQASEPSSPQRSSASRATSSPASGSTAPSVGANGGIRIDREGATTSGGSIRVQPSTKSGSE